MTKIILYRNIFLKFITIILPIFLAFSNMVCSEQVKYFSTDLPVPQNPRVSIEVSKVLISWDDCGTKYDYNLYKSIDGTNYSLVNINSDITENFYFDTQLPIAGQIFYYKVTSTLDEKESVYSEKVFVSGGV